MRKSLLLAVTVQTVIESFPLVSLFLKLTLCKGHQFVLEFFKKVLLKGLSGFHLTEGSLNAICPSYGINLFLGCVCDQGVLSLSSSQPESICSDSTTPLLVKGKALRFITKLPCRYLTRGTHGAQQKPLKNLY